MGDIDNPSSSCSLHLKYTVGWLVYSVVTVQYSRRNGNLQSKLDDALNEKERA